MSGTGWSARGRREEAVDHELCRPKKEERVDLRKIEEKRAGQLGQRAESKGMERERNQAKIKERKGKREIHFLDHFENPFQTLFGFNFQTYTNPNNTKLFSSMST